MTVYPATLDDIPDLCDLLDLLFSQEAEFEPDPARQAAGLSAIISDPHTGVILTLVDNGHIVGMVNLLFLVSTYLGARAAILEDLVVLPSHRGSGGGTILLNAAVEEARRQGCKRITLLTDHDNMGARKFYERNGFYLSSMVPYRFML